MEKLENVNNVFDDRDREFTENLEPKCLLYTPLSQTEGNCYDGSIVNGRDCNNPEVCQRYKNFNLGSR